MWPGLQRLSGPVLTNPSEHNPASGAVSAGCLHELHACPHGQTLLSRHGVSPRLLTPSLLRGSRLAGTVAKPGAGLRGGCLALALQPLLADGPLALRCGFQPPLGFLLFACPWCLWLSCPLADPGAFCFFCSVLTFTGDSLLLPRAAPLEMPYSSGSSHYLV